MNHKTKRFFFNGAIATGFATLFIASNSLATDCGGRVCNHVLEARPYHVVASCLSDAQLSRLENGFANRRGSVAFAGDDISSACIVDRDSSPRGAGVSPFHPCGFGPSPFIKEECVFAALITVGPADDDQVSIINPDSMHPGCLISANPTPHPKRISEEIADDPWTRLWDTESF